MESEPGKSKHTMQTGSDVQLGNASQGLSTGADQLSSCAPHHQSQEAQIRCLHAEELASERSRSLVLLPRKGAQAVTEARLCRRARLPLQPLEGVVAPAVLERPSPARTPQCLR
ncbi:Alpha-Methylacyl-Coa Racemase [Manis pentadactyla]|nr:Alpha-Methylacyl-Coa Racemase [Manis pentadactyla]